jgi:hypothetical protein
MAYEGEVLTMSDPDVLTFTGASVVIVSGDGPNVCGHALLYTYGGTDPHYFQIASFYDYPHYMDEAGYQRYLKETGKTELTRIPGNITNPQGSQDMLELLMSKKWVWGVLPHNCIDFVERVLIAGGSDFRTRTNCPTLSKVQQDAESALQQLDRNIRQLYGVP